MENETVPKQTYLNVVKELIRKTKDIPELISNKKSIEKEMDSLYKNREAKIVEFYQAMERINNQLEANRHLYQIMNQVQKEKEDEQMKGSN